MTPVNPNDPRPSYVQIADELRRAIVAGELKPGERIESGREMAKRHGVAQMTVHNALGVLRDEGLLVSWQGRGVFVVDPLPVRDAYTSPDELAKTVNALVTEVKSLRDRVDALEGRRTE